LSLDHEAPQQPDRRAPAPTVILVCGAAGVGKSRLAAALAARHGVPLGELDDVVTAVKALTTPEQLPAVHLWDTHPEAATWTPEKIAELHFTVADALRPAVLAVVADHLEFAAPVVIEGDYLTPDLPAGFAGFDDFAGLDGFRGAVRVVVVTEDEDQILANFAAREPDEGAQHARARVSTLVTAELARRAAAHGVPVIPARPWHDVLDRADRALRSPALEGGP
jgi:2-phosphoglycerate kinase